MSRDIRLWLEDIREACDKIQAYLEGMDAQSFFDDPRTFDAVVRNIQVIGEAIKQLPPDLKASYPAVEWAQIAGMRDVVTHAYFGIDRDIIWDVAYNRTGPLLAVVERILRDLERSAAGAGGP